MSPPLLGSRPLSDDSSQRNGRRAFRRPHRWGYARMLMRSPSLRTITAKRVCFIGLPWIVRPGEEFVFCLLGSQRNCTRTP